MQIHKSNVELLECFPLSVREDAISMLSAFPDNPHSSKTVALRTTTDVIKLPYRVYHDPESIQRSSLTPLQQELADCVLTRHCDGFVRQRALERIIASRGIYIPPFVVQLAGEYVIEILQVIQDHLQRLEQPSFEQFLAANPEFLHVTDQRMMSYWNAYYRRFARNEYAGFRIMTFFKSLAKGQR